MKLLKQIAFGIGVFALVYLFSAMIVFIWHYTGAEGFWGFEYLRSVTTAAIAILFQFVALVVLLYQKLVSKDKNLFPIWLTLLMIFGGTVVQWGPLIYSSQSINDRYKLIHRTQELLDQGHNQKALGIAKKSFEKRRDFEVSPIWFPSYLYFQSESGRERLNNETYQAAVNLAYCLQELGEDLEKAKEINKYALNLADGAFSGQEEYKLVPLLHLYTIFKAEEDYLSAGEQLSQLEELKSGLTEEEFYIKIQLLMLESVLLELRGQYVASARMKKDLYNEYLNNSENRKSTFYFQLLLIQMHNFHRNDQLDSASYTLGLLDKVAWRKTNKADYGDYLILSARHFLRVGEAKKAIRFYEKALRFHEKRQGVNSVGYRVSSSELGLLYLKADQLENASEFYGKLNNAYGQHGDEGGFTELREVMSLALYYSRMGDNEKALELAKAFETSVLRMFQGSFPVLTESERELFMRNWNNQIRLYNYILWKNSNELERGEALANASLAFKAMALYSNVSFRKSLKEFSKEKAKRYEVLLDERTQIDKQLLTTKGPEERDPLESGLDKVNKEMREISFNYWKENKREGFGENMPLWQKVRNSLKPGEVAVDIIKIPSSFEEIDQSIFVALIISRASEIPMALELMEEGGLIELLDGQAGVKSLYLDEGNSEIRAQLIDPILEMVSDSATVFIAPEGILHQISWSAIHTSREVKFRQVISLRSVHSDDSDYEIPQSALLIGNPDFTSLSTTSNVMGNRRLSFSPLPGTAKELKSIDSILGLDSINTITLSGINASEARLMESASEAKDIIHFSTHGFFIGQDNAYRLSSLFEGAGHKPDYLRDPFYRSGLVLSRRGEEYDGLLTAAEISGMDMSNTDLVVCKLPQKSDSLKIE